MNLEEVMELNCGDKVIHQYEDEHGNIIAEEWIFHHIQNSIQNPNLVVLSHKENPEIQTSVSHKSISLKRHLPSLSTVVEGYQTGHFNALEVCGAMFVAGVPNCVIKLFMEQHKQLKNAK